MANLLRKGDRTAPAKAPAPAARAAPAVTSNATGTKKLDDGASTPWELSQIWCESVAKEEATRKQWEQSYAWMAEYDPRGNIKPKKPPLENSTRFSTAVPNSRGHDYGWRLHSSLGQEIQNLQTRFDDQHKKRLPTVILGYD